MLPTDGESERVLLLFAHLRSSNPLKDRMKYLVTETAQAGDLERVDDRSGMTPLLLACRNDNQMATSLLLDAKADPNATVKNHIAESCLQIAAQFRGGHNLRLLLCAGAAVNYQGQTAVAAAAYAGLVDNVRFLVEAQADVNLSRWSALYWSTKNSSEPVLNKLLVDQRANGHQIVSITLANLGMTSLPTEGEYWDTFESLVYLDLSGNRLDDLPIALSGLPALRTVPLQGNPLSNIPPAFRESPWADIRSYLLSILHQSERFMERKVLLVGEESAGKSTVLKCLQSPYNRTDIKEDVSTHGMAVIPRVTFRPTGILSGLNRWLSSAEPEFSFTAWDLGGQEAFYPTHQFFLTSQSIYLLVFNLMKPNYPRLSYWMNQLKSSSPIGKFCPIVLVGTRKDSASQDPITLENVQRELDRLFPQQNFPAQKGFYLVECATGDGIPALKEVLVQLAAKMSFKVAPSWIKLRNILHDRGKKDHYITWKSYTQMAKRCGVPAEEIPLVTEFLRDAGSILHFADVHSRLKDLVILSPPWLAGVMSSFVSFRHKWTRDGLVPQESVVHCLKEYPSEYHEALLVLLETFRIVVRLPRKDSSYTHVLVPSLLPEKAPAGFYKPLKPSSQAPSGQWAAAFPTKTSNKWTVAFPADLIQHSRVYEFDYLPLGFFDCLLAGTFFLPFEVKHEVYWRYGALLRMTDCPSEECLVLFAQKGTATQPRWTLSIHARMDRQRFMQGASNRFLMKMVEMVEQIITGHFSTLSNQVRRYIPCLHCLQQQDTLHDPHLFPYEVCIHEVTTGHLITYCRGLQVAHRAVLISQMAPDISFRGCPILSMDALGPKESWKFLAEGGFGVVYCTTYNDQKVAVKELKKLDDSAAGLESFTEFQKEVLIMRDLQHPNIVCFIGITVNPLRIVSEFIPSGTLHGALHPREGKKKTFLSFTHKLRIAYDIAAGMNYLQSFTPPLVHRDLRSPNIFIESFNIEAAVCAKVADFGLSVYVMPDVSGVLPTWRWLAPEVIDLDSRSSYDERSDIYSYGIVLWELATGEDPYFEFHTNPDYCRETVDNEGKIHYHVIERSIREAIIHKGLRPTLPDSCCPPVLSKIIKGAWHGDPSKRPKFSEILAQLEPFIPDSVKKQAKKREGRQVQDEGGNADIVVAEESLLQKVREDNSICSTVPHPTCKMLEQEVSCLLVDAWYLWIGYYSGLLEVYNLEELEQSSFTLSKPIHSWQAHEGRIESMVRVECPTKVEVWTGGSDGKVAAWSCPDGVSSWHTHLQKYISAILPVPAPDTNSEIPSSPWVWVTASRQQAIFMFSAEDYHLITQIALPDCPSFALGMQRNLVFVGSLANVFIYDFAGRLLGEWVAHEGQARSPIKYISPAGDNLLYTSAGNSVKLWSIQAEDGVAVVLVQEQAHQNRLTTMNVLTVPRNSPGGTVELSEELWTSSYDYSALLWRLKELRPCGEIELTHNKELLRAICQFSCSHVILGSSYCKPSSGSGVPERGGVLYFFDFRALIRPNTRS